MVRVGIEVVPNKPVRDITDFCRMLEEIGVDVVWLTDHYFNRNPYVAAAAILMSTSRVFVGVGVSNTYVIHPAYLASLACTLVELSNGRFYLGLGVGDKTTLESLGIRREKALRRLRESVEIIRKLARGDVVRYSGEIFSIRNAKLAYRVKSALRIYIGAQAKKTLVLAGEIADGVLLNASHPEMVRDMLRHVYRGLEHRPQEERRSFEIVVHTCLSMSEDVEKAKKAVRPYVAFIAAGLPDEYLDKFGIRAKVEEIRKALEAGDIERASSLVSDELIDLLSITGTPQQCADRIGELLKLGSLSITLGSPLAPTLDEVRKLLKSLVEFIKGKST